MSKKNKKSKQSKSKQSKSQRRANRKSKIKQAPGRKVQSDAIFEEMNVIVQENMAAGMSYNSAVEVAAVIMKNRLIEDRMEKHGESRDKAGSNVYKFMQKMQGDVLKNKFCECGECDAEEMSEWFFWQRIRHYRGEMPAEQAFGMLDDVGDALLVSEDEAESMRDGEVDLCPFDEDVAIGWNEGGYPVILIDRKTKEYILDEDYTFEEGVELVALAMAIKNGDADELGLS